MIAQNPSATVAFFETSELSLRTGSETTVALSRAMQDIAVAVALHVVPIGHDERRPGQRDGLLVAKVANNICKTLQ